MSGSNGERDNEAWLRDLRSSGASAERAQEELREILRRGLHRAIGTRGGVDDALIEDFTQDALLKVTESIDGFRGDSRFTTWAIAVAVRTALTELRRARWRDVSLSALRVDDPFEAPEEDVEASLDRRSILEAMRRVIDESLTERQRKALLAELAGMPQDVLIEELGTQRNALYKLLYDARQKLRKGVLEAGFTEDEVRSAFEL